MDYYGDYYSGLITGSNIGRIENINKRAVKLHIQRGLSSVQIAKLVGCNYTSLLKYVDKYIPSLSGKLRDNGKKRQVRRPSA